MAGAGARLAAPLPAAGAGVSTAAVVVYSLLGYVNGVALLLPGRLGTGTAASSGRSAGRSAWAVHAVVLMAATAANNPLGAVRRRRSSSSPANIAVALFAGIAIGNRRAYVDSLRERAEREARRQIDEERLRIARELHDVVAHTMATINVQAERGHPATARPPRAGRRIAAAIRAASKDGLRELRAILNVLRHADDADPDPARAGPRPARRARRGVRAAGLPVTRHGHRAAARAARRRPTWPRSASSRRR